ERRQFSVKSNRLCPATCLSTLGDLLAQILAQVGHISYISANKLFLPWVTTSSFTQLLFACHHGLTELRRLPRVVEKRFNLIWMQTLYIVKDVRGNGAIGRDHLAWGLWVCGTKIEHGAVVVSIVAISP